MFFYPQVSAVLKDVHIRNAKPKEKPYRLPDGEWLYLEIRPNRKSGKAGKKVWLLKYRQPDNRKESILTIGEYPKVSIKQARNAADDARDLLKRGIDPNTHKKNELIKQSRVAANSFEAVAREWHANNFDKWKPTNAVKILRRLELDVFPHIGERPITELEPPDILDVCRLIESRGAFESANRIKQYIAAVYRYAIVTGKARHNPASDLRGALKAYKQQHLAALSNADLPQFFRDLDADKSMVLKLAIRFTLLTFVRTEEVRGAQWSEIGWDKAVWNIPGERMKMKLPHTVPLSRQALDLLRELHPLTCDSPFLFYTQRRSVPMSENAMLQLIRRIGWKERTTVHGFRALASSNFYDAGFRSEAIEKQLAHKEPNAVKGAYNHMARFWEERVRMMQWWADFLDSQQQGARVIPIRAGVSA
jgi:integrase